MKVRMKVTKDAFKREKIYERPLKTTDILKINTASPPLSLLRYSVKRESLMKTAGGTSAKQNFQIRQRQDEPFAPYQKNSRSR